MSGSEPLQPRDPRQIGPFRLTGYLGAGGQGSVYLAEAPDGSRVAVKVLHPQFARDAAARERRTTARPELPAPRRLPRLWARLRHARPQERWLVAGGVLMTATVIVVLAVTLNDPLTRRLPIRTTSVTPPSASFGTRIGEPIAGFKNSLYTVAVGQPGRTPIAVTDGFDDVARVWDLRTHRQLGRLGDYHEGGVTDVALGQLNGTPIAVTDGDAVRVWDLTTYRQIGRSITIRTGLITSLAVGRLGTKSVLVTGVGLTGRAVLVWDLATHHQIGEPITGHEKAVYRVAMAQLDGRPIAVSVGLDRKMTVWSLG